MGSDYMFSSRAPLSRQTLTWALVAVLLHVPVFVAFVIADEAGAAGLGWYFGAFGGTVIVAMRGMIPFLRDADASLPNAQRDRWRRWFFYVPQSAAVYWWRYVRTRKPTSVRPNEGPEEVQ